MVPSPKESPSAGLLHFIREHCLAHKTRTEPGITLHAAGEKMKMSELMDAAKGLALGIERWCNGGE